MPEVDPPSTRIRSGDSVPRRRISDPTPRRREEDHKPANGRFGALFIVVVAALFLGYVFNIAGFAASADKFFSGLNASAQSENDTVVRAVAMLYPAISLLVVATVSYFIFSILMTGVKYSSKSRKLAGRDAITLDTFRRITGARGIRPRIATQAYELLLPFYSSSMRARLDDRLVEDLHMTAAQVQDVYANLLRNTDRKAPVGDVPKLISVMDLLSAVQNARRQSLMDSMVRPAARLSGMVRAGKEPADTLREGAPR